MDLVMHSTTFCFLEAFSNLVTTNSAGQYDWLARIGSYSIHALLSKIVPQVLSKIVLKIFNNTSN